MDRDRGQYYEHVENIEACEVIVHKDHPLTKHCGFGSAKFKK
jgi:hypothetical protein